MPIYEYACTTCGHEFEKLVRMNAEPPPCPECASEVRKRVSAAGFILKGGGWYKDHYGLKKSSDSSSSSSGGSDASSKAKAVNKAAATSSSSDS